MTKEEFERSYCEVFDITLATLASRGKFAVPASRDAPCDYPGCEGWHMVYRRMWEEEVKAGLRNKADLDLFPPKENPSEQ